LENLAPLYDSHDFWDSQPVPKAYETITLEQYDNPIDIDRKVEEVRDKPYNLPSGFYWADVDITNRDEAHEVYELLTQNYVEDDDNMFRFDYSIEFL
jgi:glycylpeptide N-tetradecanoyltransferase